MTNGTKSELISHRRIAAETNSLLLFPARFAHAHYSSGMIDRFPNWGDDGKPNGGKIKGRCQLPLASIVLIYYTSLQIMRHTWPRDTAEIFGGKFAYFEGEKLVL